MNDHLSFLDVALDDSLGFDPLGAFDEIEDNAPEAKPENSDTPRSSSQTPTEETRSAAERIADLFSAMATHRKTLLGMITFCADVRTTDELDDEVNRLQEDRFSVYAPANLANLLERAGALARVTSEGDPYPEGDPEPELVVVDGMSYYEPGNAPTVCWVATEDGAAYAAADAPLDRLTELLHKDAAYASIYARVLALCAEEGGASMSALEQAIDNDELLKSPRLYAPHFVAKLEQCDAVTWKKAWQITEIGRAGQQLIADLLAAQNTQIASDDESER